MSLPRLRRAGDSDADAIQVLVAEAYGAYVPLIGRTPSPMLIDYATAVRTRDVWVVDDGGVVAVLDLELREEHIWLENVAVSPSEQGRGLGRWLMAHAESEARARGLDEIRLLTNERYLDNIAMYRRYGYRETHREAYLGTDRVYFAKRLADASTNP